VLASTAWLKKGNLVREMAPYHEHNTVEAQLQAFFTSELRKRKMVTSML
jgi:hypothetical protein